MSRLISAMGRSVPATPNRLAIRVYRNEKSASNSMIQNKKLESIYYYLVLELNSEYYLFRFECFTETQSLFNRLPALINHSL
jgi:hypothetical protein